MISGGSAIFGNIHVSSSEGTEVLHSEPGRTVHGEDLRHPKWAKILYACNMYVTWINIYIYIYICLSYTNHNTYILFYAWPGANRKSNAFHALIYFPCRIVQYSVCYLLWEACLVVNHSTVSFITTPWLIDIYEQSSPSLNYICHLFWIDRCLHYTPED